MCHFIPTQTSVDAQGTAQLFRDFVHHGVPEGIVSDRDTRFTEKFMTDLCKLLGIKQRMSSAYHPHTDGQTERVNRVLKDMLGNYVGPDQDDWDQHLSTCEFVVNTPYHTGLQTTPFMLNYGYHPRSTYITHSREAGSAANPAAVKMKNDMQESLVGARNALKQAQDREKYYADQHRREINFNVGDKILLSTRNIKIKGRKVPKLMPNYRPLRDH